MSSFGPYSPLRRVGDLFFVSGQVGVDSDTKQAGAGIAEQVHQALKNLQGVLASANLQMDDVVKTTVFLKNMDDFGAVNDIYVTYFAEPRPARSCVEVSRLPKIGRNELLIEIEAVAVKGKR